MTLWLSLWGILTAGLIGAVAQQADRIRGLKDALNARITLLGQHETRFEKAEHLLAGEKIVLSDTAGNILEVETEHAARVTVRVFDR